MKWKSKWWAGILTVGFFLIVGFWLGGNGRILSEHTVGRSGILGVAPDGKFVVAGSADFSLIDKEGKAEPLSVSGSPMMIRDGIVMTNGVLFSFGTPGVGGIQMIDWSGQSVWTYRTNAPVGRPTVDSNNNVYFFGPNWVVHSLDPKGNVRWVYPYPSTAAGFQLNAPTVSPDGRIALYGARPGGLIVLDQDGNELWRDADLATEAGRSGAVFMENGDLLVSHGWYLRRFDQSGNLIWTLHFPNVPGKSSPYLNGHPIVSLDGSIYCLGEDQVFSISPGGEVRWSFTLNEATKKSWSMSFRGDWGAITPKGDLLLFAGDFEDLRPTNLVGPVESSVRNERVICLRPNGELKWEQALPSSIMWSIPKNKWELELIWKTRMGLRTTKYPRFINVDSDGTIYVSGFAGGEGKLWAIDGN